MDKNNLIGFGLMFLVLVGYFYMTQPSPEEIAEAKRMEDSLLVAKQQEQEPEATINPPQEKLTEVPDSIKALLANRDYGVFGSATQGEETLYTLENNEIKLTFSSKGGRIVDAELKNHKKITEDAEGNEIKEPLKLLDDKKDVFEFVFDVPGAAAKQVSTNDLYFDAQQNGNSIVFNADLGEGRSFKQSYTLEDGTFHLQYKVAQNGLEPYLDKNSDKVKFRWINYLDQLERNVDFERMYSTMYFKPAEDNVDYCSCRSDDTEVVENPVKWVSAANQFFNTTIVATDKPFRDGIMATESVPENGDDLKKVSAFLDISKDELADGFEMKMFIGPNDFKQLAAFEEDLEYIIPYGWSIFGTINRYVIRPLFSFLMGLVGIEGIAIILVTLIVKLLVFPLTYRSLYSQSKMQALKPRLEKVRAKYPDDQQKAQMESMKLYREYGVNPAGGCLPMMLQMPIWYALFRFFPSTIDFRQASFLWATDLSSYDVFLRLPFEIPFYGAHVSLFTILWAVTTIVYTYFNTKHMDMSAQPAMKYVQYAMPLMFLFFFNNYAAGLTCYMFFSNLLNIGQNTFTKQFLINKDKIEAELQKNKAKPKKQSGFQARLQKMLEEQQEIAKKQENNKNKKNKR